MKTNQKYLKRVCGTDRPADGEGGGAGGGGSGGESSGNQAEADAKRSRPDRWGEMTSKQRQNWQKRHWR